MKLPHFLFLAANSLVLPQWNSPASPAHPAARSSCPTLPLTQAATPLSVLPFDVISPLCFHLLIISHSPAHSQPASSHPRLTCPQPAGPLPSPTLCVLAVCLPRYAPVGVRVQEQDTGPLSGEHLWGRAVWEKCPSSFGNCQSPGGPVKTDPRAPPSQFPFQ